MAVPGRDPFRILVTGAGLAAGFGVATYDETLAGRLARLIADRTGRGVAVQITSALMLPAKAAIKHIGSLGGQRFHAVVFVPCYLEASFAPRSGMRRFGPAIQRHLIEVTDPGARIVMVGLPRPTRFSSADLAAVEVVARVNAAMRATAETETSVAFLQPPDFASVHDAVPFDGPYYDRLGVAVGEAILAGHGTHA